MPVKRKAAKAKKGNSLDAVAKRTKFILSLAGDGKAIKDLLFDLRQLIDICDYKLNMIEKLYFGKKKPPKKRSITKSSISGKFVSKAAAKDNPYSTYTTKRK